MLDMPLVQSGAIVSIAISNDEDHPASNVIDGNESTFWMTTGLLPQSLTISFPQVIEIKEIKVTSFKVKNLVIEKSMKSNPVDFEIITEKSYKNDDRKLQLGQFDMGRGVEARHLKFTVPESYDSFIAIQHIHAVLNKLSR